ncbi:MAG: exosortase/archaeosortase family protein [Sulfurimonas sp.]|jgi:exosortase/archaeosortase family protein
MLRFITLYLLFISLSFLLIEHDYFKSWLQINALYTVWVTLISAKMMSLFVSLQYDTTFIHLPTLSLEIKFGCNGLESIVLYISAVLAYKATLKEKLYGLGIGLLSIYAINISRIMVLGYVGVNHFEYFDVMHTYITQNIMIVLVFFVFLIYINFVKSHEQQHSTNE